MRSRRRTERFFFSSRRRHTRSLCDWSSDVCSSDLGSCAVPHNQQGEIIRLARASREILDRFEHAFLKLLQRTLRLACKNLLEARHTEEFIFGIHGLSYSVGEEYERIPRFEFEARRRVLRFGHQSHRERAFGKRFFGRSPPDQEWRG